MTGFQHVAAMDVMDWTMRHEYWDRLQRRRSFRLMRAIAKHFSPDELSEGHNLPVQGGRYCITGQIIPLPDTVRVRQLSLSDVGFVRSVRTRTD